MAQGTTGTPLLRLPEDALYRVQLHLAALDLAFFRTASATCDALVRRSYESKLVKEGLPRNLTLRQLHRRQTALFHEDFRGHVWCTSKWQLGPHRDEAYSARDVMTVEGDRAGKLCVGCRVVVTGVEVKGPEQRSAIWVDGPFDGIDPDSCPWIPDDLNGTEGFLAGRRDGKWDVYILLPDDQSYFVSVDESNLRLAYTPDPNSKCFALIGGQPMNFNGIYHAFKKPIKPAKISFRFMTTQQTDVRGYTNFFLSSASEAYPSTPTFWMGSPPTPADTFTLLIPCAGAYQPIAWLPSGVATTLGRIPEQISMPDLPPRQAPQAGAWHQCDIYFDWDSMHVLFLLDGRGSTVHVSQTGREWRPFTHPATDAHVMQNGFTHLYLFTWIEGDASPAAEAYFSDIWFEESHSDPIQEKNLFDMFAFGSHSSDDESEDDDLEFYDAQSGDEFDEEV